MLDIEYNGMSFGLFCYDAEADRPFSR